MIGEGYGQNIMSMRKNKTDFFPFHPLRQRLISIPNGQHEQQRICFYSYLLYPTHPPKLSQRPSSFEFGPLCTTSYCTVTCFWCLESAGTANSLRILKFFPRILGIRIFLCFPAFNDMTFYIWLTETFETVGTCITYVYIYTPLKRVIFYHSLI